MHSKIKKGRSSHVENPNHQRWISNQSLVSESQAIDGGQTTKGSRGESGIAIIDREKNILFDWLKTTELQLNKHLVCEILVEYRAR